MVADFGAAQVMERGSGGWGAPVTVASGASAYQNDAALVAPSDGSAPVLLVRTAGGLLFARQSEGWPLHLLTSAWPIVGFGWDANQKLYAVIVTGQDFGGPAPVALTAVFRQQ
jgi:hypothetical protein